MGWATMPPGDGVAESRGSSDGSRPPHRNGWMAATHGSIEHQMCWKCHDGASVECPPDGGRDSVSVQRPNAPVVRQQCNRRYCRVKLSGGDRGSLQWTGRGASHDLIDRPVRSGGSTNFIISPPSFPSILSWISDPSLSFSLSLFPCHHPSSLQSNVPLQYARMPMN